MKTGSKATSKKTLKGRLDVLEQVIKKPSIFPKWPPPDFGRCGGLDHMRQLLTDHVAELVRISRRKNYPPHPASADRLKLEAAYLERRAIQPEHIRPEHPTPLTQAELQQM